ncbi:hypothetical protein TNCV_1677541 [Trichonephila clavipes]|nr:hypothetical protein TNCV_1677541 [Trichonephila clavipes]
MLLLSSSSFGGLFQKVKIFRYPQRKKSGIDKSWERGGQSPLTDDLFIGLLCKVVSTSMDTLLDFFLSPTDPVSRNRITECVIVDVFGAVSPGYWISPELHLSPAMIFCSEMKLHDGYSLLLEKIHAHAVVLNYYN